MAFPSKATAETQSGNILLAQVTSPGADPAETDEPVDNQVDLNQPRFTCQFVEGRYTVIYHPQSQPGQTYPWATPTTLGGGWSEERRCNEISRRLELYRPDGLLEMRASVENDYDIVCVTTQQNSDCRILFTVPPGQDPIATRDRVFENLTIADGGQQTQAVNTFVGRGDNSITDRLSEIFNLNLPPLSGPEHSSSFADSIDLRPFLDQADGGTGANLQKSRGSQPGPRLSPDNFR
ncbi:MAG: hypothetical protein F6K19_17800 [Cyanothece sp. SIO1E1]|nr:hypothetical protein [Cyanothece sp. SIO1E1]